MSRAKARMISKNLHWKILRQTCQVCNVYTYVYHVCMFYLFCVGTWQTKAVFPSSSLTKISSQVPLQMASMLLVNPTTAYRMLKDFVHLKEGTL